MPGLMDSEVTSLLTPIVQALFAREPDAPAAQLLIAHGWDTATSQFTGPLHRSELATALVRLQTTEEDPMDVDGASSSVPAVSEREAGSFLWVHPQYICLVTKVQKEQPGMTVQRATEILMLRHRAAVKVQRAFRASRPAYRHRPWLQKEVSLKEAVEFLCGKPTLVTLAMDIWNNEGSPSIGRATETLMLRHRAKARVHAELAAGGSPGLKGTRPGAPRDSHELPRPHHPRRVRP